MCRWMGSHFHDWIDYNGVTFLVELLEWGRTFMGFLGYENSGKQKFKSIVGRFAVNKWFVLLFLCLTVGSH